MEEALIRITGNVQGVFFRATAREQAQKLDLTGYARNLHDGSVEILVQGNPEHIDRLLEWCKEGPPAADVSTAEILYRQKPSEKLTGFQVE